MKRPASGLRIHFPTPCGKTKLAASSGGGNTSDGKDSSIESNSNRSHAPSSAIRTRKSPSGSRSSSSKVQRTTFSVSTCKAKRPANCSQLERPVRCQTCPTSIEPSSCHAMALMRHRAPPILSSICAEPSAFKVKRNASFSCFKIIVFKVKITALLMVESHHVALARIQIERAVKFNFQNCDIGIQFGLRHLDPQNSRQVGPRCAAERAVFHFGV